jgi:O-antigen ligase
VQNILTTTAPRRTNAISRVPDAARAVGFALGLLLIEIVLARSVAGPWAPKLLLLLVGGLALAAILRFPLASALIYLTITDFIFYPLKFAHQVGPVNLRSFELILVVLLILAVARPKRRTWGGRAGGALVAFYVLLVIASALAISGHHTDLKEALTWGRPMFLLSFFWVVIRLFPERREREVLLAGAATIAAATGVMAVVVTADPSLGTYLGEAATNTVREQGSLSRVRLPGLSMAYGLFWFTALQVTTKVGKPRLWWSVVFFGIVLNIVFSFNRNMWIGIGVGFVVLLILGGPLVRKRLGIACLVLATAVTFFVMVGGSTGKETVQPIVERGETLVNPAKTAHESSVDQRLAETEAAWKTARDNLLFGIGPGVPFGFAIAEAQRTSSGTIYSITHLPQLFLHNQYLYLLMITGIPGLLAFLFFLGTPLLNGLRFLRDDLLMLGCAIGIGMIMVSAVVAIYFTVVDMTAVLGLLAGVVTAGVDEAREREA